MSDLQKAISIAVKYHRNQKDSEGMPKILHSCNVMFQMETEFEMIVGILHDVVEDTEYTLMMLEKDGFSKDVVYAIDSITHRGKETYEDYINRVKDNPVAIKIKLADLTNNMDIKRMNRISKEQMIKYIKKYKPTWDNLKSVEIRDLQYYKIKSLDMNKKYKLSFMYKKAYKYMKRMRKMNDLEKAISIAVKAHENQKDKAGMPYILHPLYVMMQMENEKDKIVAVLHDVVEDTEYDLEYLKGQGFSDEVLKAVECLTKREDEDYFRYIDRVALNDISSKVKIKDLEHNMDLKRIGTITEKDILRIVNKYKPAWDKLKEKK